MNNKQNDLNETIAKIKEDLTQGVDDHVQSLQKVSKLEDKALNQHYMLKSAPIFRKRKLKMKKLQNGKNVSKTKRDKLEQNDS